MTPDPLDLAEAIEHIARLRREQPGLFYRPHQRGQEQFHRAAGRKIRVMFPGNRWGKTTAMAMEAEWEIQGTHPYHRPAPGTKIVLWIAPQYSQIETLRPQIESQCFTRGFTWNETKHTWTWPGKGVLRVVPADRDWYYIQGINPDLVLCDEEPPIGLWRELQARRFGVRDGRKVLARYVIAATATMGDSWMEAGLYRPWLDHHLRAGLSEEQAVVQQLHPDIWCWPRGGIGDNPHAGVEDVQHMEAVPWSSDGERAVRMTGGFHSFRVMPVFDAAGVAWLRSHIQPAPVGTLRWQQV